MFRWLAGGLPPSFETRSKGSLCLNIRWTSPVVAIALCVSAVLSPGLARAASWDSAPPLPAPTGTVVNVSTESQLQSAVKAAVGGTTIVVAPGTYTLTSTLYLNGVNDVTLRGATNNRDDVVLVGRGMTNGDFGAVEFGIWTNGQRITIANLTVRDIYDHAIILNAGAQSPRIFNVHLINTGQQFIKANPDGGGGGVNNGIVEYSVIEYTGSSRDDYTNGVDVHTGSGWIVRHNLFRNIAAPNGALAGPAVLMWNGSRGAIVEGNTFINCQREISMGLTDRTPNDNSGGIVRNNFIYRQAGLLGDAAILVADSAGTQVLHNTILLNGTYPSAIEYRFSATTGGLIANNLSSAGIRARDGAAGTVAANYVNAAASMFVNPANGDLHLVAGATAVINKIAAAPNAPADWDGETRPGDSTVDYGADEFGGGVTAPVTPTPTNQPPTVSLVSPVAGATFTAAATIALTATAADGDGSVSSVSFYSGGTLLGADTSSPYAFSWANVPAGTYALTAVAVDNAGGSTTSAAASVTVGAPGASALPAPWVAGDLGSPATAGSTAYASGAFAVAAGGLDIWNTSDQFRFVYQPLAGDGEVVARVASLSNPDPWAKAGVMIREQLTANSAYAAMVVTAANGAAFQRRAGSGQSATHSPGAAQGAPYWVKLIRAGASIRALQSANGSTWTEIGSDTIPMAATVYVGLAVVAHTSPAAATASFTDVAVTKGATNAPPTVSLTAPANGASYTAPASVTVTATAADADGTVARVDFYSGASLIGSDSSSPYAFTWTGVGAGAYGVAALAVDNAGATATSGTATIAVVGAVTAPTRTLLFTLSADNDTNVTSYKVEIYPVGADPASAAPAAAQHLGKPTGVAGIVTVDIQPLVAPLAAGSYIASVTAVGPGGATRGASSNAFTR
jgi:hypothetical protein